jgi:hypothetical protein
LIGYGHDHDRCLLAGGGKRGEQSLLALRILDPNMLPTPFELVKLQLHRNSAATMHRAATGLS